MVAAAGVSALYYAGLWSSGYATAILGAPPLAAAWLANAMCAATAMPWPWPRAGLLRRGRGRNRLPAGHDALRLDEPPREVVLHLRVVARRRDERRPQHLLLARLQRVLQVLLQPGVLRSRCPACSWDTTSTSV